MIISQYYHKFNKSVLPLTLQSRRFFQPEVDFKHSESDWNQDSEPCIYDFGCCTQIFISDLEVDVIYRICIQINSLCKWSETVKSTKQKSLTLIMIILLFWGTIYHSHVIHITVTSMAINRCIIFHALLDWDFRSYKLDTDRV